MAIGILSIKYQSETRGAVDLSVLQACIGEKIKVIIELYFDDIFIPRDVDDKVAIYVPDPDQSGRIYNNDIIFFTDGEFLNGAQVGDDFIAVSTTVNQAGGTYKLLEIISGGIGRFDRSFIHDRLTADYVANVTSLKSLIYQFGINAGGDYNSRTDGSLQKFSISSGTALTDIVSQVLQAYGNLDWQIDTITLAGEGDDPNFPADSHVRIKLTHETVITPLFLTGQLDDIKSGIAPGYFKADNSIKYQAQIDWNKSNTYLDPAKSITIDPIGQFGWFNKRFDGAKSDYSITSLTIQRVSDSAFVNQLEYNEMEVIFNLHSASGAMHTANSALVFGFNRLPENSALYQDTNNLLETNFVFESKLFTPNNIAVNGNNFGTSKQVIKTIKGQVLDGNNIKVTVRILFGSSRAAVLQQEDEANYAMWIICENKSYDIQLCDKANMLIQVDTIHVQLTKINLLSETTKFIEHPYDILEAGKNTLQMFPVDDVAINSLFELDYNGLENNGILLKACTPAIVLTHATEADIILDSFRINLDNFPTVGSSPAVQAIDFNQLRPYKIENGIRKFISFQRDFALDVDSKKYFALNFPFMNRWEYWLKVSGLTSIPESLFDSTVPFNGANNLWNRLANSTGWSLVYRITFQILQNGKLFEQEFEQELTSTDFGSNTEWTNNSIKTYDITTNDEIIVSAKKYAYGTKDTKVVCHFEKTVGDVPNIDNIAIVIWGESFEGGGISEITRISSVYDVEDISIFKSVDSSNKVKLTKTGNIFTGEALIRGDKIQNLSKLSLYGRIYVIDDLEDDARVTNDFILRLTNDDQIRLVIHG